MKENGERMDAPPRKTIGRAGLKAQPVFLMALADPVHQRFGRMNVVHIVTVVEFLGRFVELPYAPQLTLLSGCADGEA